MTAGRGIVHSEMPQQAQGRMRGFQLWLNLPGREKMRDPGYVDLQPEAIPKVPLPDGGLVHVIAGTFGADGRLTRGPIGGRSDRAVVFRRAPPGGREIRASAARRAQRVRLLVRRRASGRAIGSPTPLAPHAAGVLSPISQVGEDAEARFLLVAVRPIGEPRAVRPVRDEHSRRDRAGFAGVLARGFPDSLLLRPTCD